MRARRLLPLPLLALGACLSRSATAPRPAQAPAVTPEARREAEQAYSQAVSAYVEGAYDISRDFLKEVLRLDPRHEGARTLREKLAAVEKASRP